jgi:aspartate/methionine/tyrosine aminotransferase
MVFLTPDNSQEVLDVLLQHAAEHDWWIVWDISGHTRSSTFHPAQQKALAPRVITIGGWEDQLPGWQVAWMAGSEAAEKLRAFHQSMTICTTNVSQWAALALMEAK